MSALCWRRAARVDVPELSAFLAAREERCAGFAGRLLREGELRLPSPIRGGIWLAELDSGGIAGALLCHPSGLAFPVLPAERGEDGLLAKDLARISAARIWRAASATGLAADVDRLEAALGLEALVRVGYLLMSLPAPAAGGAPQTTSPNASDRGAGPGGEGSGRQGGFSVRRARPEDLGALYPLQEAYEREEVLTPIHGFDAAACRVALARTLERQLVYVAEEEGPGGSRRIVAKAGTNARGFAVDQIGGVYTLPERRGRGAAAALMAALLARIGCEGRGASLFVKPGNVPAIALYRRLGFGEIGDYRADYFRY